MSSLKSWFRRIQWPWSSKRGTDCWGSVRPTTRHLGHEPLESRTLLSVSPSTTALESIGLSNPSDYTQVGEICYFTAEESDCGRELWAAIGTEETSYLVKDINIGSDSSDPSELTQVNDRLFFVADDGENGRELWTSNGTDSGTFMVKDVYPGDLPDNSDLDAASLQAIDEYLGSAVGTQSAPAISLLSLSTTDDESARLSIWIDGEEVEIPAEVGVYSDDSTADAYTADTDGVVYFDDGDGITLGDFFEIWRTDAGNAGDEEDATFDDDELMGRESDTDYTVQMFVNGEVCTDFEDYVIQDGDEIILVYSDNPVVAVNTNYGPIVIELFESDTPITVENFLTYINDGSYIDSIIHRSDPDFVIQGGGYTTDSSTFTDTSQFTEIDDHGEIENESLLSNEYGTIAMARTSDYDSATSQFYINLDDNDFLDPTSSTSYDGYTVFGRVLDMTTVEIIEALPVDSTNSSPFGELPYSSSDILVVVESVEGLGDITGYKFYDADGDGVFDSDEDGIEGVTVFIDANDNGELDDGETWTTTDSDGKYLLQVEPGDYVVRAEFTSGSTATVESVDVTVQIGVETSDVDFGEVTVSVPTGIDLVDGSDTGLYDDDDLTNRNNADTDTTLAFLISGVTDGAEVHVYCDGVEIGTATASGTTVTVTTDGQTEITDGEHAFTATQEIDGVESDASDSLTVTIDTDAPAAIASTAPDIAEILVEYTFDADSPDEGETGLRYSLSGAPDGMSIDTQTGVISWTPTAEQGAPQLFDIIVVDAAGNQAIQTVDMTVLGEPPAYADSYATYEEETLTVDADSGLLLNDDPDDEYGTLTASLVDGAAHGTVTVGTDGSFTYIPQTDFYGTDSFTYKVTAGSYTSNVVKVTITVVGVQEAPVGTEDEYSVDEDGTLTVDADAGVLANDSDVDGDELTAAVSVYPSHGTLQFYSDGSFEYKPEGNYAGTDSFTYILSDGTVSTDPITVTIAVDEVDDAPVGEDDEYTMDEDDTLSVDADTGVLANDTDEDSDTLTADLVDEPEHGSISFDADGSFTYEPDEDFVGTDTFTYTVSDDTTTSDEITVTITVENVSDAPVAEDDDFDVDNDGVVNVLDVLENDSDPDASESFAIVSVTQGSDGGTVAIIGDELLYTPEAGFTGTETFTYTIQDEAGNEATATITMTVEAGSNTGETGDSSLSGYVYIDTDGNGEFGGQEMGLSGVLVTLTGTTDAGNAVSRQRLTDDDGHYSFDDLPSGTYKLTENQPAIMVDGADSSSVSGAVVGNDVISNIVLGDAESFDANNFGELRVRPAYLTVRMFFASTSLREYFRTLVACGEQHAGNTTLATAISDGDTIYGTDSDNGNNTDSNATPTGDEDEYTLDEDETLTVDATDGVLENDSDDDDDTLSAALVDGPSHGTLSLQSDGSFEYVPDANFSGTDTFTYVVYDGTAISEPVTVTLAVEAVDDAPVAAADEYSVDENTTLAVDASEGVLKNDIDDDGDDLSAVLVTDVQHGELTLNSNGSFEYLPDVNFSGTDTFTYYAGDGTLSSDAVVVTITVKEGNDAPVGTDDTYSVDEDGTLTVDADNGVLDNDSDDDGDDLEAELVDGPAHGTLWLEDDGSFTYEPDADYSGTDTFTYRATDGDLSSEEVTVTITIDAVNDAPVGTADEYAVVPNGQLDVSIEDGLLSNDVDVDGDSLTASLVADVAHGTLTFKPDGSFTYVPLADYHGTDTFTYTISDGTAVSEAITVTISVNTQAVAGDDAYEMDEDGVLQIDAAGGVLANDSDPDADNLKAVLVTGPEHGELVLNQDGSFTYKPDANFCGTDTFTYAADDDYLNPTVATVTITVKSVNDVPVAEPDSYTVDEDGELIVDIEAGVLWNDTDDGAHIAIVVDGPGHGTLDFEECGAFIYEPDADFHGTDTFTYYLIDGEYNSETVTVTITVNSVNDLPAAADDAETLDSVAAVDIDVLANDTDADTDDTLAIASFDATSQEGAAVTLNSDGTLHYDPTVSSSLVAGSATADSFTYTITDGHTGTSVTGTVTITIDQSGVTYITFSGDSISVTGDGATVDGTTVTVTSARTYRISGTLNDGQLIVDTDDEEDVILILGGASITCSDSAPIYVVNASDTVITLAAGTENYVTDGDTYTYATGTDEPDAAIFSNDDLVFNGTGSLTVNANFNHGISSSDDLDINGGNITVNAVNHGIRGKDSVVMLDGTVTVTAGGDGIQSDNDEDTDKGYVTIEGGTLDITADSDGIQAETTLTISGGDITISADSKGLKAGVNITIEAATVDTASVDVDSTDDAINCNGTITISGGDITLATDDDAIHADSTIEITGGDIDITTCYEGIEGPDISIDDATISIVSDNDGISGSSDDGSSAVVSISGGTVTIDAGTDGIQSEAELNISGGTVDITTGGGNSASLGSDVSAKGLKADGDIVVTAGTITIDSADDAIHADDTVTISGGDITITSGDDGIHAENSIAIDGGEIDITKSYEGIESIVVTVSDGTIHLVSSDDGINIAGGNSGGNGMSADPNAYFELSGGYIWMNAQGDGCDSNGSVYMSGGTMIVNGPTANMNGALDYNGTFEITGGYLLAVGSSGMAESTSSSSTQETLFFYYGSTQAAGTMVHIETEDGDEILTFVPVKAYQSVVLCSSELSIGTTYVVYSGGSSTGTETDGLYSGGTYTAGTELGSVTLS